MSPARVLRPVPSATSITQSTQATPDRGRQPGRWNIDPAIMGHNMIAGSFGRYLAQTARDHGNGVGPGAESAAAGAGATTEVPGPGRPAVTSQRKRTHGPSGRPPGAA